MYLLAWKQMILVSFCSLCNGKGLPDALLNRSSITFIPNDMEPATMTYLIIMHTNIQTLDLRQLLPYTSLARLEVPLSPVSRVITADLPSLTFLQLNSLKMTTPPYLGPLCTKLKGFSISESVITAIPDNYFTNFTQLTSLGLMDLGLNSLREIWFENLIRLRDLYISKNPLRVLPNLVLWIPNLMRLYAKRMGLTSIPVSLIKGMRKPRVLDVADNRITDVPDRMDFDPLERWKVINFRGNPLHCSEKLCWIQVRIWMQLVLNYVLWQLCLTNIV